MCWNSVARICDYYFVDCEDFREALSARLDNEEGARDADHPTDAHLEFCADCRYWYDAAALITRRTRTSAVVAWPDVSGAVLARVPPGAERPWLRTRLGLGAVGALQCATGLVTLVTQAGAAFETGAWQVGLGVTLGAVAVRRLPACPAASTPPASPRSCSPRPRSCSWCCCPGWQVPPRATPPHPSPPRTACDGRSRTTMSLNW